MRWLYYRFIYRWLMRLAHRYNWHHTRTCFPEGDTLVICDWCGLRQITNRVPRVPYHLSTVEQEAFRAAALRSTSTGVKR